MDEQSTNLSSTDVADEQVTPKESGKRSLKGCIPDLPPWVVVALMILALMITGVVIRNIAGPLSDLVFGTNTEVPIPDGATLNGEDEGGSASRTMRYSTNQDACAVYRFYLEQEDVECRITPFACNSDGTLNQGNDSSSFRTVGSCAKTESDRVGGSSWRVTISGGYSNGPATRFFVEVFE